MSVDKYLEERARRKGGAIPRGAYFHKPEKIDWSKTRCTYCGSKILYVPNQDFDGTLTCNIQKCKKEFRIPSLDGFIQ